MTLFQNGRELRAAKAQKPPPKLLFRPAAELEPFTGRYELAPGRVFTVSINASTLFIELTGQPALPVFETRPGHFEYDTVDAAVEFATDDTGAVIALVLHQNGVHIAPRQTEKP